MGLIRHNGVAAARIVDALLFDLIGRSGLSACWDDIDRDTKLEIRDCWIRKAEDILAS